MAEIALVLLPGLHGNDVQFRPLLAHLPPQIRPIAVNYPPDQPLDYAQLLPLVLAALPEDQPFVLLGESFSGPLAIMAAARARRVCAALSSAPRSCAIRCGCGHPGCASSRMASHSIISRNSRPSQRSFWDMDHPR